MLQKNILIFIDWFLPGYKAGGPIQSVANFVTAFKQEFEISIVTSDRDLGDTKPYNNIECNTWLYINGIHIIYLSPEKQNKNFYTSIFLGKSYDFVYLNSFFSISFTLKPLLVAKNYSCKIILAPRGMLGKGALSIKPFKKHLFISLAKMFNLHKNVRWLATAESEQQEIKEIFGNKAEIFIAPNLTTKRLTDNITRFKESNLLKLFFLSRISEKKNLIFALEQLIKVHSYYQVEFNIIGPVDGVNYWEQCQHLISNLPYNIKVNYLGPVQNTEITSHLTKFHFLLLPTLHENYGHAILEAMQCGCPVIISNRTPWRNLQDQESRTKNQEPRLGNEILLSRYNNSSQSSSIEKLKTENLELETINFKYSVGWDLPLENPDAFVKVIEYCASMGQDEYTAMSHRAFEYAQKVVNNPAVLEANRQLFK